MAIGLAGFHLSSSNIALLYPGIARLLRSRFACIRQRSWLCMTRMYEIDKHIVIDLIQSFWDKLDESDVTVLNATTIFLLKTAIYKEQCLAQDIEVWTRKMLLNAVSLEFTVLICNLLKVASLMYLPDIEQIAFSAADTSNHPHVILEALRILAKVESKHLNGLLYIPSKYLVEDTFHIGLLLLEPFIRYNPKFILNFQQPLLQALSSDDLQLRLKALQILKHASNSENWRVLLSNCVQVAHLVDVMTVDTGIKASRIAIDLIAKHSEGNKLEQILSFLNNMPTFIEEELYAVEMAEFILTLRPLDKLIITREYVVDQSHSVFHDMVLIQLLAELMDKEVAERLLIEVLEKHFDDPYMVQSVLSKLEHVPSVERLWNYPNDAVRKCIYQILGKEPSDLEVYEQHLSRLQPVQVEEDSQESPEVDQPRFLTVEELPQFPVAFEQEIQITSDLFKGLL